MFFVFGRASLVKEGFPGAWSQDSYWLQEGPWAGGQVLRLITITSLLTARMIKAVCLGIAVCKFLVLSYRIIYFIFFPQHMELSMENPAPSNAEIPYTRWERCLISFTEVNATATCALFLSFFIFCLFFFTWLVDIGTINRFFSYIYLMMLVCVLLDSFYCRLLGKGIWLSLYYSSGETAFVL